MTSYSYDASKGELVSYDTPHITTLKAQYVQNNGLAGSMFWDVSVFTACRSQYGADRLLPPSSPPTKSARTPLSVPRLVSMVALTRLRCVP